MKQLLILIFAIMIGFTSLNKYPKEDVTYLIFYNCDCLPFYPNTEKTFWEQTVYLDTVILIGKALNHFFDKKVQKLSVINKNNKIVIDMAAIRIRNGNIRDTLYSTSLLNYWKYNGVLYFDSTGYFRRNYQHFFLPIFSDD